MKNIKRVISAALAAVILLCLLSVGAFAQSESVQKPAIITGGAVNVREAPNTDSARIGGVTLGSEVFVMEKITEGSDSWYKINYGNGVGYIMSKYAALVMEIGRVSTGALNVRGEANESSARIGGLTLGAGVYILGEVSSPESSWYKISFGDGVGYVKTDYVGIFGMPGNENYGADYKNTVTLKINVRNLPKDYKLTIEDKTFVSDGSKEIFSAEFPLGTVTESRQVTVKAFDPNGVIKGGKIIKINVDNGFFAKIRAFFTFIFSGFKNPSKTVTVA